MHMQIFNRKQAKIFGIKKYFTGQPCKNGHLSERYTSGGGCMVCADISRPNYLDKQKETAKIYYQNNKEKINKRTRKNQQNNKEKYNALNRAWVARNKERAKACRKAWAQKNNKKLNYFSAKRRAEIINATPKWANLKEIKKIYESCPDGYQVDHIVPLNSKFVCGLHVEANMQYLTPKDNVAKKNHWWPDMW